VNTRNEFDPLYIEWRKAVLKRDKHKCQMPDLKPCWRTKKLQAHHIFRWADAPSLRYEERNGITLCSYHHYLIRNNEDNFVDMFMGIVKAKYK
jgi:hypothetical protein